MIRLVWGMVLLLVAAGCIPLTPHSLETVVVPPVTDAVVVSPAPDFDPLIEIEAVPEYDLLLTAAVQAGLLAPVPPFVENFIAHRPPLQYTGDILIENNPRVDKLVAYYSGPARKMFGRWLERAGKHIPQIQLVFASEGLPLDLAYLAMIESGFNEKAYSWAHAAGPWQFIESTGRVYGLDNNWWIDERRDIEKSTIAAAHFLKYLNGRFDGEWYLAVAAYNAGGGKVRKAIRKADSRDFWDLANGKVLRAETKNYVPKLLAALTIVRDLEGYGFADLDFEHQPKYETVTLSTTTDIEVIAKLSGGDYNEIKALNPELKRWCTPPGVRDYQLRVPAGRGTIFRSAYADLPHSERAQYHRHKIVSGDNLRSLARKYRIQVDDIMSLNNIKNPRTLQIGTNLILPLREGFTSLPINELADDYQRSRRQLYKVRSGDSLWKISQRFGVTQKQLRVWNKLGWSNLLRPGQVLAVSKRGQKKVPRKKVAKYTGPAKKMVYKVRRGDTLWGIGRQFDVATDKIRSWNGLTHNHVLQPGQKLTLHVPVSRRS